MELLKLYKNIGETPLECIERFRKENPKYLNTKTTYAGRLDPMAEGLLLVLAGDTKEKEKYLGLNKTYEFEVLLGIETDTHDILGKVFQNNNCDIVRNCGQYRNYSVKEIENVLKEIKKIKKQKYPNYSSRTVLGIPLFSWARQNKIEDIEVPEKEINIFDIKFLDERKILKNDLLNEVISKIEKVKGDFRQKEIINTWQNFLENSKQENFAILSFVADVSSGTYIRGLASEIGKMLGTEALAYSIKRTKVGEWVL